VAAAVDTTEPAARRWPYIVTATKVRRFVACERLPYMDEYRDPEEARVPQAVMLDHDLGLRHERDIGDELRAGTLGNEPVRPVVVEVRGHAAFAQTLAHMRAGQQVIEQGLLIDEDWWGRPDYLHRRPGPSALGDWHYEPGDAKVGSRKKVLGLQILPITFYALLLERIQGVRPARFTIYRGLPSIPDAPQTPKVIETAAHVAQTRAVIAALRESLSGHDPGPRLTSECEKCKWRYACEADARERRDLSLITGMRRDVRPLLESRGIRTIDDLAGTRVERLAAVPKVNAEWAARAVEQARAYLDRAAGSRPRLRFTPDLPPRASTEIYLDIEGEGLDNATDAVLFGLLVRRGSRATYWKALAKSPTDRRRAWRAFCAKVSTLRAAVPIFHYGAYDEQVVRGMHARHGGGRHVLDRLVDVHKRIAPHLVIAARGTGAQVVAEALGFERRSSATSGRTATAWWQAWVNDGDRSARAALLRYNEDDLRGLAVIMDWAREPHAPGP